MTRTKGCGAADAVQVDAKANDYDEEEDYGVGADAAKDAELHDAVSEPARKPKKVGKVLPPPAAVANGPVPPKEPPAPPLLAMAKRMQQQKTDGTSYSVRSLRDSTRFAGWAVKCRNPECTFLVHSSARFSDDGEGGTFEGHCCRKCWDWNKLRPTGQSGVAHGKLCERIDAATGGYVPK